MNIDDLDDKVILVGDVKNTLPISNVYVICGRFNDQIIIELDLPSPFVDKQIIPKLKMEVSAGYGEFYCKEYLKINVSRTINK